MSSRKLITQDLGRAVLGRTRPGLTVWNRLEGRARRDDFDGSLRAEVHDPLWMLTRQWQLGEFLGDDAGSPVEAKVKISTRELTKYQAAGGSTEPFSDAIPLEAKVEQLAVPRTAAGARRAMDIRLLAGRHWLKLLRKISSEAVADLVADYLAAYAIESREPENPAHAGTSAHREALAETQLVAGRLMDGLALYDYLIADPSHQASDGIAAAAGLEAQINALGERFTQWFKRLIYEPEETEAWLPDRLEYQFELSAPLATGAGRSDQGGGDRNEAQEQVFEAEEYFHGHLDWYNFDQKRRSGKDSGGTGSTSDRDPRRMITRTMVPTQVTFSGMPHTRWWRFENGRTNFGNIKPDTTDLGKLLLIEFALLYANDWFLVPFTLGAGSVANVEGVAVTNVFGERVWVQPAGAGIDDNWERWAMFVLSRNDRPKEADLSLLIPPAAQKVQESPPREEVMLVRDEVANMVWGIERQVELPTGMSKPGGETAQQTRAFFERLLEQRLGAPPEPPPMAEGANIRYRVMSSVPENWIPMIPVHREGESRQTQLQRASMPRILTGDPDPPVPVRPRTSLLRQRIDEGEPYYLHEEEVPRAGVRVMQSFQRTRWRDGRVWVWLGIRKQTGRGEASSGLAFDGLIHRRRG